MGGVGAILVKKSCSVRDRLFLIIKLEGVRKFYRNWNPQSGNVGVPKVHVTALSKVECWQLRCARNECSFVILQWIFARDGYFV